MEPFRNPYAKAARPTEMWMDVLLNALETISKQIAQVSYQLDYLIKQADDQEGG